ncbi:MAG: hypothetical protein ABEJ02_03425 [Candidatus Paceibacteria bacterium]
MNFHFNKNFFYLGLIFLFTLGLFVSSNTDVLADTTSTSATINATTPSGSGGGGGSNSSPTISNISTSTRIKSATVTWDASDDKGVKKCEFHYSDGVNLNNTASTTESGGTYTAKVKNLTPTTTYNFKIKCFDDVQSSEKTGQFTTLDQAIIDLKLAAVPAKRVKKKGGNLQLKFTLFIADPKTNNIMLKTTGTTNSKGVYTAQNIKSGPGKAHAYLKGRSHLAKKIVGVNIKDGKTVNLDFTDNGNFKLIPGDTAGKGTKDNFIDILDLSKVLTKMNTADKDTDLNRDGITDILDLSILLNNFNKSGDQLP